MAVSVSSTVSTVPPATSQRKGAALPANSAAAGSGNAAASKANTVVNNNTSSPVAAITQSSSAPAPSVAATNAAVYTPRSLAASASQNSAGLGQLKSGVALQPSAKVALNAPASASSNVGFKDNSAGGVENTKAVNVVEGKSGENKETAADRFSQQSGQKNAQSQQASNTVAGNEAENKPTKELPRNGGGSEKVVVASDTQAQVKKAQQEQQAQQEALAIRELVGRDREVRLHEAAHAAVGGQHAGGASFSFTRGPNGVQYAVAGEVSIDLAAVAGDASATARKMDVVRAAALAPANPSAQDRRVAAEAARRGQAARVEIQKTATAEAETAGKIKVEDEGENENNERSVRGFDKETDRLASGSTAAQGVLKAEAGFNTDSAVVSGTAKLLSSKAAAFANAGGNERDRAAGSLLDLRA